MIATSGWRPFQRNWVVPLAEGSLHSAAPRRGRGASSPLLTVVMATLNAAPHLPRSLGSLAEQDSRDFEVVVVDGGSTDQTCDQANSILQDACISHRIVELPGSGIYAAVNRGVTEASGEWIYVMGADDLMFPGVLAALSPVLRSVEPKALVVHGDVWIEDPGYRYGQAWDWPRFLDRNISHQSAFYRRIPIAKMGISYDERYRLYADWDYNLKLFATGRFAYTPLLIASYACSGASSGREDKLFLDEKERNVRRYLGWRAVFLLPPYRFARAFDAQAPWPSRLPLLFNRLFWALKRTLR